MRPVENITPPKLERTAERKPFQETISVPIPDKGLIDIKIDDNNLWDGPLKFRFDTGGYGGYKKDIVKCQKSAIEYYYCGFLQYYDTIVRSNMTEHFVYFKWVDEKPIGTKVSSDLTIYIYPPPIKVKEAVAALQLKLRGKGPVPETAQLSPLAPPPTGGDADAVAVSSDPPTGPQPPPP
jgi:hypothetical protein